MAASTAAAPANQELKSESAFTNASFEPPERPKITTRQTLVLAFLSLGVIYGDIGTSTLYTLNGIFPAAGAMPSEEDIVGGVSAIVWAILLVPVIKYCLIALEFGTSHGEGGPFAVFTTLYPPRQSKQDGWRTLTTYTMATAPPSSLAATSFLHRPLIKLFLFCLTLFGVCLTVADGMLTPAVSVTSAIVGLSYGAPKAANAVVGISCGVLVVLFMVQPFGTKKIATLFSPIVLVWLGLNGICGIINIAAHPAIFRAFDPSRAVMLFVRTKNFDLLAGVILCITGVEALFANLGQFSKGSIRLAFCCFAAPCLVLQYLGQGAKLVTGGEAVLSNVFFNAIPGGVGGGLWWTVWIFAVLAAVIASQAMITATFSLVEQLVSLNVMPPIRIVHTDSTSRGRIFVPAVNFLVLVGTLGLTIGFGTEAGLTNAYGLAVSGVMIITTTILAVAMAQVKHLPVLVAIGYFLLSAFIDGLFFGASLKKVPTGAWFSIGLATILLVLLLGWSWARGLEEQFDKNHRYRLSEIMKPSRGGADAAATEKKDAKEGEGKTETETAAVAQLERGGEAGPVQRRRPHPPAYEATVGGASLARLPVFALFHNHSSSSSDGAPHSFVGFLRSYPALPRIIVFLSVRVVGVPHVTPEDRYLVDRLRQFDGLYTATVSFGYRDKIDLSDVARPLRDRIVALESRSVEGRGALEEKVAKIDEALNGAVTHILPHYHVSADKSSRRPWLVNYLRSFMLEEVYRRVKVNFDAYEGWDFGSEEDVLRMGVAATL
ncbi:hypothetical protein NBRC10512_000086 [Rhodotorula toruloides]|uniref:RHTO0S09e05732g1_1 n=2 Tax=Rhodotorula toruloides TaxID=5286 RepID=A0A061B4Z9_RHOTO|nr:potassium transporter [Rhodotorula toruloides NP11]EMS19955.1 potassium transporter [Rhodotorula toruloides NP11]CDR44533.1 RHTO0S09e05732g1_1 [Rhodotorula toruloides]